MLHFPVKESSGQQPESPIDSKAPSMQALQRWIGVKDDVKARKKVVTIDLFQHILIPTSGGPLADDRLNVDDDAREALDNLAKCAARVAVKLAAICRVDLYTFGRRRKTRRQEDLPPPTPPTLPSSAFTGCFTMNSQKVFSSQERVF